MSSDWGAWNRGLCHARAEATRFVATLSGADDLTRLTAQSEFSDYARCFRIFLAHTLGVALEVESTAMAEAVRLAVRRQRKTVGEQFRGKPFRQLLAFSLSALHILNALAEDPLDELVVEQLPLDVGKELDCFGCLDGVAGSGNQAMFVAIFLIHARDMLQRDTSSGIAAWIDLHMKAINRYGFWGAARHVTHLQFQNGYHQHEILEYLGIDNPRLAETLTAVRGLADVEGHFAPYPGGGGCYDYDAVFMLTPDGRIPDEATRELLCRTAVFIASEQRPDGGFAESIRVRPRSLRNLGKFASHVLAARGNWPLFAERMRYALTLQRSKHDRIHTHWSRYSRRWDESDLWDTWFRMLALARIDVAMNQEHASRWGFIDYPGIGYHPSLRKAHT